MAKLISKKEIYMNEIEKTQTRINALVTELKNGERSVEDFNHEMSKATWAMLTWTDKLEDLG